MSDDVMRRFNREFRRTDEGGWLEVGAALPEDSKARIFDPAIVFSEAASSMHGGTFRGGTFRGGEFRGGAFFDGEFFGGEFFGGEFRGGEFCGGEFFGGEFRGGAFFDGKFFDGKFFDGEFFGGKFFGGEFRGGEFRGGAFFDGEFFDGEFFGGKFRGGEFASSPSTAQRSDGYVFVAKYIGDDLRIWAGCRNFSWDEAVAHWNDSHYAGPESQRIIHFLKAQEDSKRGGE